MFLLLNKDFKCFFVVLFCLFILKTDFACAQSGDTVVKHFIHKVHGDLKKIEKDLFNLKSKKIVNPLVFQPDTIYHLDNEVLGFYPF